RYSGVHGNDEANIDKLLKNLDGVPREKRTARFVCAACCVFPNGKKITARGECEGEIL
ncbi:MAG TPA: non-canonical purine NTP pyrophosphatase, partial [Ruminococcaceae bacterium]|nr:non-canonical purine NTP pyrophosphatase [Oscillospiraceae bacterium]